MQLDPASGWCLGISHRPSPNFNCRPLGEVSLLVIHNISLPPGQFGTGKVQEFFQNCLDPAEHPYFEGIRDLKVSAHFLIERDGAVTQFVSCNERDNAEFAGVHDRLTAQAARFFPVAGLVNCPVVFVQ